MLPTDKQARKERPMARGLLDYFPDALAEVARVSFVANEQHNPGEPMHWAREKSTDHADCIMRHLIDRDEVDDDGLLHSAKVAWRALAMLQVEVEARAERWEDSPADAERSAVIETGSVATARDLVNLGREMLGTLYDLTTPADSPACIGTGSLYDPTRPVDVSGPARKVSSEEQVAKPGRGRYNGIMRCTAQQFSDIWGSMLLQLPERIAATIMGGVWGPICPTPDILGCRWAYIAGPMTGKPELNFPAFIQARDLLRVQGYAVINPADIDIAEGDAAAGLPGAHYAKRDLNALLWMALRSGPQSNYIAMLPGWEDSVGGVAEYFVARWLGFSVLDATNGDLIDETIKLCRE